MNDRDGNLAFKCAYHDGGRTGFVGYQGTCSDANIIRNITKKKVIWCSHTHNRRNASLQRGFQGRRPEPQPKPLSYESRLLIDWEFVGGFYHFEDE